jgi:gamma-glutamyltranspeptidase/glutathione hydrolase
MSTMMSPCIVERDNEVDFVLGSAGANRLRSAIVQTIVHHVDYGFGVNEAVNLPRVHFEEGELHLEASDDPALVAALEARGYDVKAWERKSLFFGGCNTAARRPVVGADGETIIGHALHGAGDRRREGASITV